MPEENIPQIKPSLLEPKTVFQKIEEEQKDVRNEGGPVIPNVLNRSKYTDGKESSKFKRFFNARKHEFKIVGLGLLAIVFIVTVLLANLAMKARKVYQQAKVLKTVAASQDFTKIKAELTVFNSSLKSLQKSYKLIAWMRIIPFFGGYVKDGLHTINAGVYGVEVAGIFIDTAEPYADLIGFSAASANQGGEKTAADRIDFIVKTIPDLLPKVNEIGTKMSQVKSEVDYINPKRYPKELGGKKIRENIEAGIDLINQACDFVVNGKPLLERASYLLGLDSPRTYLVLFQNDKELRPTGGFMTAYSIMKVDKAKFEPVSSDDIYHLDAKYKPSLPAPQEVIDHLKGPYVLSSNLRLRDMNWSPDFETSMQTFVDEIKKVGIEDIDGVIAVDTQLLVNLLKVLGPIGVPGFGNFSTDIVSECNCPQVIYELESFADVEGPVVWDPAGTGKIIYQPANADNRKKIIGPLMNSILSNAFGQPKEKLPNLFAAGFASLQEKHVLFYLLDDKAQAAVDSFGIAGKVKDYVGDYLLINDANLGGRKSNLYVTQEVQQEIVIGKDRSVEKTVSITYKNPKEYDGWLNSVLPNWVRIYVPKGSKLVSFEGIEEQRSYEEFGKTVFAGFFELRPQGVQKVIVKYKLPLKFKDKYQLLVQKQAGLDQPLYSVKLGKQEQELFLKADKEFKFSL